MPKSVFELIDLDGTNGVKINGINEGDGSGISVSSAGDVNGDGVDDIIIGASGADANGSASGASYVVFGSANWLSESLELSSLDGTNGFQINGIDENDYSGMSASSAGDFNGDGFDDIIIGAIGADPNGESSGESYVVFGSAEWLSGSIELSALDGTNGFQINGIDEYDHSGWSVSSAGDFNDDGFDDIIIGAPDAESQTGESYLIYGSAEWLSGSIDLRPVYNSLDGYSVHWFDGQNGIKISGIDDNDWSGSSVSSAGDFNGDGIDDIIIGASSADPNGSNSGESYIVYGFANGSSANFNLTQLKYGYSGFKINGINEGDGSGRSVSSAGDFNGDGIDDIIIGASLADPNGFRSGESYIVLGSASWISASLDLSWIAFQINGNDENDWSGRSVSSAGDFNGDGFDDIIIGATGADPNGSKSGASYVVFGSSDWHPQGTIDLSSLDGTNGFQINGINEQDESGSSVSSAGDFNGDGIDDIIIGASLADPNGSNSGASYVIFGERINSSPTGTIVITGTAAEDQVLKAVSTLADVDGLGALSYQWEADGTDITGATYNTLTLGPSEVGKEITVSVSYTDGFGTLESVISAATLAVSKVNSTPTGAVTITGTATEDQVLTAVSSLTDEDGLGTLSYQWKAGGISISNATSSTLTLGQSEVGKEITVSVSYTDGFGTPETVTSAATSAVANVNDTPTGAVTITGTATEDQVLTAVSSLTDEDGLGTLSYQWKAGGISISNATSSTLTLGPSEVGKEITVSVSYTDGFGTPESIISIPTQTIEPKRTFDIVRTSEVDGVATFEIYADASVDPENDGIGSFNFTLSHDSSDMLIDENSIISGTGYSGVPNYNATTGVLIAGGFALPSVTDLSIPLATFSATILDDTNPIDLTISEVSVDGDPYDGVMEAFNFSSVDVESNVIGRGSKALSDVSVSYDFVTPSEDSQLIELALQETGKVTYAIDRGSDLTVTADMDIDSASDKAIGAFDALQALRLAVGLDKSDGTSEWHDYIAADINKDGRVGADDALNILKFAVGLTDGPSADWVFVDADADYSEIDRKNTDYDEGILISDVMTDMSINMTGILVGDVDGSYIA